MKEKSVVIDCGAGFTKALFSDVAPGGAEVHHIGYEMVQNMPVYLQRSLFDDREVYRELRTRICDFMRKFDSSPDRSTASVSEQVVDELNGEGQREEDYRTYMMLLTMGTQFLHNSLSQQLMCIGSTTSKFVRLLKRLEQRETSRISAFVTTNYDQVLDIIVFDEINPQSVSFEDINKWEDRYRYGDCIPDELKVLSNDDLGPEDLKKENPLGEKDDFKPVLKLNGSVNWLFKVSDGIYLPLGQKILFQKLMENNAYQNGFIPPLPKNCDEELLNFYANKLPVDQECQIKEASGYVRDADVTLFIGHSLKDGADQNWLEELQEIWDEYDEKTFIFVTKGEDAMVERELRAQMFPARDSNELYVHKHGLDSFLDGSIQSGMYRACGL